MKKAVIKCTFSSEKQSKISFFFNPSAFFFVTD